MKYTFANMASWNVTQLRDVRADLRDKLSQEIQNRDALKAEIMYLQAEIEKYKAEC